VNNFDSPASTYTFKDTKGRTWDLYLTLAGAQRIDQSDFSEVYGKPFSILSPTKEFFTEVITNTGLIFGMIWCLVKPQADSKDISQEDFLEAVDGNVIQEARDAFWGTLTNFFPEYKTMLLSLIKQYKEGLLKIGQEMDKLSQTALPEAMNRVIDKSMQDLRNELSKV